MATISILERGMLLRDVGARTLDGKLVQVSDFRGRRNLILIFAGAAGEESALVNELRRRSEDLREEEAAVLIAEDGPDARRLYGAATARGELAPAVYVSDRYGEIFFTARGEPGQALPGAGELLEWVRFVNSQCPE